MAIRNYYLKKDRHPDDKTESNTRYEGARAFLRGDSINDNVYRRLGDPELVSWFRAGWFAEQEKHGPTIFDQYDSECIPGN